MMSFLEVGSNKKWINILFNDFGIPHRFEISEDLKTEWDIKNNRYFGEVQIPSYDKYPLKPVVCCFTVNESLPSGSISVPAAKFGVNPLHPTINQCTLKILKDQPVVLETVTFLANPKLYKRLECFQKDTEKFNFFCSKFGIIDKQSVIHLDDDISKPWCKVVDCTPSNTGIVDFNKTQIYFLEDTHSLLESKANLFDSISPTVPSKKSSNTRIQLSCLKHPVLRELYKNELPLTNDDTIFAFASFEVFQSVGVIDGNYITISNDTTSMTLQLFLLLQPNGYSNTKLFVHPRVMANFWKSGDVIVEKCESEFTNFAVASSVSLARVGNFYHSQKKYENLILHNLKKFLTEKERVLRCKQLIPIGFDSTFSSLYSDDIENVDDNLLNDSVVWFSIEKAEIENEDYDNGTLKDFIINPSRTKLVTENIISKHPLQMNNPTFHKYYDLVLPPKYDTNKFDYAKRFFNILEASLNCFEKSIPISTSIILQSGTPNTGKSTLVKSGSLYLGFHLLEIDCASLPVTNVGSLDSVSKTVGYIKAKVESVLPYTTPSIIYLSHIDILLRKDDSNQDPQVSNISKLMDIEVTKFINEILSKFKGTIFVCSTNNFDSLPTTFTSNLKFDINVSVPDENQRKEIFKWYLATDVLNRGIQGGYVFNSSNDLLLSKLALQSAGLTPWDIKFTIDKAKSKSLQNCIKHNNSNNDINNICKISMVDIKESIGDVRDEYSTSIGAPKIPNVTWDDIGGIDIVKGEIMDTIDMPLKHPELFASGMKKRSGVLFYGPPGTGKTLMAKAIATNFSLNFFSVKGPELLNMYIGESEANVRRVFQKARDAKPCVIFFDELDSVAPKRGNQGDSGGVMDRIVSQLLAELDGMSTGGDGVFVIGATNRPDLLDEALLRPGRFDKLLFLGIPDNNDKQLNILQALTRKFELGENVNLSEVAEQCPFNYSGADFYALCSDAMLNAMTRIAKEVDEKIKKYNETNGTNLSVRYWSDHIATDEDVKVVVNMSDFLTAQKELIPSISHDELQHYLRVKSNFESTDNGDNPVSS
ncbi:hypothetical protein Kpol_1014p31 [Vanderwaltozyma polyspora DSM 70294]|uniref:Peroxisomal ATPase PEX6 n=1 Tax=Vanderwaltozyma polyspora (strain ATCC 22028 / DSM 70294 / BCRC 21397 / CBS 2163 / NBRC 10782 / NRRL Y-8283 / UCD 57-17) TaxID=436907 RepID=A7TNF8_VANPO|nr:uncharacterized protein Kpol_1014p31 [Vanderwaltozyma polyspora DSM 70294]EDO16211.1 hypothetical protein Kpol_1014p31 [Vanderwaltozyma polyspora DSM 70294]